MFIKSLSILSLTVAVTAVGMGLESHAADEAKAAKHKIKDVMTKAMKKGQWKKLASGEASQAESDELVELFTALGENKPPKGDEKEWAKKTDALVAAAKAAAAKEEGAREKLEKATKCADCHRDHKA